VLRHAGARHVEVVLRYEQTALDIEVLDDGDACREGTGAPGFGLAGMAERVAEVGGRLVAGPRPDGAGFGVHARLPVDAP